ncbi:hypothetical protein C8F01DRAFT_1338560 [Mycena amicta]|nr:hypothetical protein C8F01DRAFT_1338560 [Mycena amicta]
MGSPGRCRRVERDGCLGSSPREVSATFFSIVPRVMIQAASHWHKSSSCRLSSIIPRTIFRYTVQAPWTHPQQQQQTTGLYLPLPSQDLLAIRKDSYSAGFASFAAASDHDHEQVVFASVDCRHSGGSIPTRGYTSSGHTSPPSFQVNRYQVPDSSRQPISRPTSSVSVREDTREWDPADALQIRLE